ncbi:MAG TPA: ABC transporter substrate-binding protein [Gemmatimonadales bacterium]|nr:ABC transporter substrate-binding protein [Gemmatimonadales bacterium]
MTRRTIRTLCWLCVVGTGACGGGAAATAARRGATVLYAAGADLESINPLLTAVHPLAKQVQRYVLLTTLVRYDSTLAPQPYLARRWVWSTDRAMVTFTLYGGLAWDDGRPTVARDVVWTLDAARDPATGYARLRDLAAVAEVRAPDDTTVVVRFHAAQPRLPDVFTDLAILPAHLLDSVPHSQLRRAAWNEHPVGNGPFRFVAHEPHRRWEFARNPAFPVALGGPPRLERFIVVVVDEPMTKLAALTAGELDFAGINPAHADFVRRNPDLAVLGYPLIFVDGLVFNTRRPPFDDETVRRAAALAIDRNEIVQGFLFGFGDPADGPVPPFVPGYVRVPPVPFAPDSARRLLAGRHPSVVLLTVGSGEAALEQLLQARLAAVGFDASIRQLELSAFLGRVYGPRHDFTAAVVGIPGDPGLGYLASIADMSGIQVPADPGAAQRELAARQAAAWLYVGRGAAGMNRRVHGVTMDMRGELVSVARWWTAP